MYLTNLPTQITKKDIKYLGDIMKDESYSYILSDISNDNINNTYKLNSEGFYSYIYNICNTYLFLIGNSKGLKDINPNKIDFISKILKFEYLLQNNSKQIKELKTQNNMFTIMSKESFIEGNLKGLDIKMIDCITDKIKIHLRAFERPLERYLRYLCDNEEGIGTCENACVVNTLIDNKLYIQKDTSMSGYIIKYRHDKYI